MDPAKLNTISKWPYPQNIRELYCFLGFNNFYKRFIDHFSDLAAPLTALTRDRVDIRSGLAFDNSKRSFSSLVKAFSSAPFLLHFDFAKPRVLQVDCSGYALSAILSQPNKSQRLRPVSYLYRKLTPAKQQWQVHDQELGAIVAGFEEWRAWLVGTNAPVAVFSDHANLCYFMTSQKLTPRQVRWASYLSSFYFNILHTPGKQNPADPASRRPDYVSSSSIDDNLKTLLTPSRLREGVTVMSLAPSVASIDTKFSLPAPVTRKLLSDAYSTETEFLTSPKSKLYCWQGNLWWYRDRLYVPQAARNTILTDFHDSPAVGHPGIARILSLLT